MPIVVIGVTADGTLYDADEWVGFSADCAAGVRQSGCSDYEQAGESLGWYVRIPQRYTVADITRIAYDLPRRSSPTVYYIPRLFGRGLAYGVVGPVFRAATPNGIFRWVDGYKTLPGG